MIGPPRWWTLDMLHLLVFVDFWHWSLRNVRLRFLLYVRLGPVRPCRLSEGGFWGSCCQRVKWSGRNLKETKGGRGLQRRHLAAVTTQCNTHTERRARDFKRLLEVTAHLDFHSSNPVYSRWLNRNRQGIDFPGKDGCGKLHICENRLEDNLEGNWCLLRPFPFLLKDKWIREMLQCCLCFCYEGRFAVFSQPLFIFS